MQSLIKLALALICIGGGIRWLVAAWSGKEAVGQPAEDRKSAIVQTVFAILAILFGLAILRIPLE